MKKVIHVILLIGLISQFWIYSIFAKTIIFEVDATPYDYGIIKDKKTDFTFKEEFTEEIQEDIKVKNTIYDLYSSEEIQLLFKTVETETYGADYESKKNVASVILNRQEQYGKSLKEIITSPNQFCYSKNNISDLTIKACEDALDNRGNVLGALYFRSDKRPETWNGRPFITSDGNHNFY